MDPQQDQQQQEQTDIFGLQQKISNELDSNNGTEQQVPKLYEMESEFMTYMFPIFRGVGMLILFHILISINISEWTRVRLNFPKIMKMDYLQLKINAKQSYQDRAFYQQLIIEKIKKLGSQIRKRGFMFAFLFALMVLYYQAYVFSSASDTFNLKQIKFLPKEYAPLIIYLGYFIYLAYPSNRVLDGRGRIYFFQLFGKCFSFGLCETVFPIIFATDMLISMVGPLKDINYTLCYYIYTDKKTKSQLQYCKSLESLNFSVLIIMLPYVLRTLQCIRQGYTAGKFFNTAPFYNMIKYSSSILVIIISYAIHTYQSAEKYLTLGIIFAILTTLYSYFWDLKMDWNVFQTLKNKRKRYPNIVYYILICTNLVLRFVWLLTLCHNGCSKIEMFKFFAYFGEIIRRFLWNFLRMEKEHLYYNCHSSLNKQNKYIQQQEEQDDEIQDQHQQQDNIMSQEIEDLQLDLKIQRPISSIDSLRKRQSEDEVVEINLTHTQNFFQQNIQLQTIQYQDWKLQKQSITQALDDISTKSNSNENSKKNIEIVQQDSLQVNNDQKLNLKRQKSMTDRIRDVIQIYSSENLDAEELDQEEMNTTVSINLLENSQSL